MTLKEIGRFEYNGYTFIILEEKTKDYFGKPFFNIITLSINVPI